MLTVYQPENLRVICIKSMRLGQKSNPFSPEITEFSLLLTAFL